MKYYVEVILRHPVENKLKKSQMIYTIAVDASKYPEMIDGFLVVTDNDLDTTHIHMDMVAYYQVERMSKSNL